MRLALASALLLGACANTPQREETAPPLVVPPLAPDAGATATPAEPRREIDSPLAIPARDPRPATRSPRSPLDLRSEIASLEREATESAMHALGDAYCELARAETSRDARAKAIATYDELVTRHPSYAALDEVLYFLGLEYELSGDKTRARRTYYELIKRRPDSQYVPYAYFAFGEIFFEETASDPSKKMLAEQAYREVLKYPTTPLRNEAQSRLDDLRKR